MRSCDAVEPLPDLPPPPAPPPRKSALAFFAVLLALFLPGMLAQAALPAAGLVWTELFGFLLPALVATAGSNLRAGAWLKLGRPRAAPVLAGAAVGAAGFLFAGAVMAVTQRLLPEPWVRVFDPAQLFEGPAWERLAISGAAVALAPVCEEAAFRGYVLSALALRRGRAAAIGGSALLFAIIHLDPVRFPALLALGAVFGWLVVRSGSLWPAVAAHAVNNGITAGIVLAVGVERPAEPPPARDLALALAAGAAALALLLRAYRAVTPVAPPPEASLALRDPASPSIAFSSARVPRALGWAAAVGVALLATLLALAGGEAPGPERNEPEAPLPAGEDGHGG
jgi:membrane protease YdiL (CAAX protease family)